MLVALPPIGVHVAFREIFLLGGCDGAAIMELRLLTAELRSDAALRGARGRSVVEVSARDAYLRKLYGGR